MVKTLPLPLGSIKVEGTATMPNTDELPRQHENTQFPQLKSIAEKIDAAMPE